MAVDLVDCQGGDERERHELVGPSGYELCLVRLGCFLVRGPGWRRETLLDPLTAAFGGPGNLAEVRHQAGIGDRDTVVVISERLMAQLGRDDLTLPAYTRLSSGAVRAHYRLLTAARTDSGDSFAVEEAAISMFAEALREAEAARTDDDYPSRRRHRDLVEHARGLLASHSPDADNVAALSDAVGCSPHHLSRVFRQLTGRGIAHHRLELRLAQALELLSGGETNLSKVAADCGFADQAHLSHTCRALLGSTPTVVRRELIHGCPGGNAPSLGSR